MTYPTITPLPNAPQRNQSPEAFVTTADTFLAALPNLVTDVNAAGAFIDTKTISVGNDFQGEYSSGTNYSTGQSVSFDETFYLSLVDNNTGNTPDSSPSQWVEIAGSAAAGGGPILEALSGTTPTVNYDNANLFTITCLRSRRQTQRRLASLALARQVGST
jgi:hypothetical protein